jgi:hypothetical protein
MANFHVQVTGPAGDCVRRARSLLDQGHYRLAFEEAMKAKSISLPASYRVLGSGRLWPSDFTVEGASAPVELTVRGVGKALRVDSDSTAPFRLTANGLPPHCRLLLHRSDRLAGERVTADASGRVAASVPAGGHTLETTAAPLSGVLRSGKPALTSGRH